MSNIIRKIDNIIDLLEREVPKRMFIRTGRIDKNGNYIISISEKIGERYQQTGLGVIINFKNMTILDWDGNLILRHKFGDRFIDEIGE